MPGDGVKQVSATRRSVDKMQVRWGSGWGEMGWLEGVGFHVGRLSGHFLLPFLLLFPDL